MFGGIWRRTLKNGASYFFNGMERGARHWNWRRCLKRVARPIFQRDGKGVDATGLGDTALKNGAY